MIIALSLIALVFGYRVFLAATAEKEGIKILGQVIGVFVMIASILLIFFSFCPSYGKFLGGSCIYKSVNTVKSGPICPLSRAQNS